MERRKRIAIVVLLIVAAVVAVGVWLLGNGGEAEGLAASGTVEATDGRLGFQAAGRIQEIRVQEGDPVGRGDTLAVLDTVEVAARREAEAAAVQAELSELEAGFRSEEVAQARSALDQTPAVDPAEPEPIPDHASRGAHKMNQTPSW